jgi:hypothetical protein
MRVAALLAERCRTIKLGSVCLNQPGRALDGDVSSPESGYFLRVVLPGASPCILYIAPMGHVTSVDTYMTPTRWQKRYLRRLLSLVPTPGWKRRYPRLNRLESCKKNALCDILLQHSGHMVFAGPFSTMRLDPSLNLATDPRMIVGSYEEEVQGFVNEVICAQPSRVVDIGSAFGYYAVGFALKIARTSVIAFEAVEDPHWPQLATLARINNVGEKIQQRGLCGIRELSEVCEPNAFVLSDCEGAEEDLLDPGAVPQLRTCRLLVELHEFYRPMVAGKLIARFAATHDIRVVEESRRDVDRYRILKYLPAGWRSVAIEEGKWTEDSGGETSTWLRFMLLTPKGG